MLCAKIDIHVDASLCVPYHIPVSGTSAESPPPALSCGKLWDSFKIDKPGCSEEGPTTTASPPMSRCFSSSFANRSLPRRGKNKAKSANQFLLRSQAIRFISPTVVQLISSNTFLGKDICIYLFLLERTRTVLSRSVSVICAQFAIRDSVYKQKSHGSNNIDRGCLSDDRQKRQRRDQPHHCSLPSDPTHLI